MKVKEYGTKPLTVKAIQYTGSNFKELREFCGQQIFIDEYLKKVYITTIEGKMKVHNGDYIIQGVLGEFYPCNRLAFDNKYYEITKEG